MPDVWESLSEATSELLALLQEPESRLSALRREIAALELETAELLGQDPAAPAFRSPKLTLIEGGLSLVPKDAA